MHLARGAGVGVRGTGLGFYLQKYTKNWYHLLSVILLLSFLCFHMSPIPTLHQHPGAHTAISFSLSAVAMDTKAIPAKQIQRGGMGPRSCDM